MGWKIYFWAMAAYLLLTLPFKVFEYASGRDRSAARVKVEEMANVVFFLVGLVGLYGFVYGQQFATPWFWRAWLLVAIALSIAGLVWSPKVQYAVEVMGKTRTRIIMAVSSLAFLPMLVGIWRYSSGAA
jgi:hypothetical protein